MCRWEQAVASAHNTYCGLAPDIRLQLNGLIEEIMQLKQDMLKLVFSAGSSAVCRSCGGECCKHGKYHVTVLDILAYVTTATEPVTPNFSNGPSCPYSDAAGCLMLPRYRPMTCVIFNCDLIEDRLTLSNRETLQVHELKLRDTISRAVRICAVRIDRPVLLIP